MFQKTKSNGVITTGSLVFLASCPVSIPALLGDVRLFNLGFICN